MNMTWQVKRRLPRRQHMACSRKAAGNRSGWDLGLSAKMLHIAAMALTKPTFPAPDHDHDRCAADGIHHAERVCEQRAQKFTPIRRQVLQALLSSHRPLGAYEVVDELAKSMSRPAPITVYRALDFLMETASSTVSKAAMRISPARMIMTRRRWWRF